MYLISKVSGIKRSRFESAGRPANSQRHPLIVVKLSSSKFETKSIDSTDFRTRPANSERDPLMDLVPNLLDDNSRRRKVRRDASVCSRQTFSKSAEWLFYIVNLGLRILHSKFKIEDFA